MGLEELKEIEFDVEPGDDEFERTVEIRTETWYSVPLDGGYVLSDNQWQLISNCPPHVGVFWGLDMQNSPALYISPGGLSVALAFGSPCETPDIDRLTEVPGTEGNFL